MNESSRDTSSVFGKAAGTAMGIGVGLGAGAAGISALAYTGKAVGGAAVKSAKGTHAAVKSVQRDLGERLVNNMDDMGRGVAGSVRGTNAATKNIQRDLGERLVNNMDDMGKGAKSGINKILKTFSKAK